MVNGWFPPCASRSVAGTEPTPMNTRNPVPNTSARSF
jgi:hypothetical protein